MYTSIQFLTTSANQST